jgi:uncharacterized protein YjbI with pentapeptide repeats
MRTHADRDLRLLVARSSFGAHHAPLDLANTNLELANLFAVDLRGANLAGANLRGAMLWSARLDGACLDGADLTCANLTWADMVGCSMREALLIEADLDEALVGGDAVDNGIVRAFTAGADMITINYHSPALENWSKQFREANSEEDRARLMAEVEVEPDPVHEARDQALLKHHLEHASASLRMRGAGRMEDKGEELERAKARVLTDDDLQELLRWSGATGKPLNLRGCNLTGANLRHANLDGACLAFADLRGADIHGARFEGADTYETYWSKRRSRRSRAALDL